MNEYFFFSFALTILIIIVISHLLSVTRKSQQTPDIRGTQAYFLSTLTESSKNILSNLEKKMHSFMSHKQISLQYKSMQYIFSLIE